MNGLHCSWLLLRDPSRNFFKINPAKYEIRLIFGLAVFCREFEFSAKLRLTEKFSAKIQIILNNIKTDIAHYSAVAAD